MFINSKFGKLIPFDLLREPIKSWIGEDMEILDHINMFTAQKMIVVGWLASQTDMLANDWFVLEDD